MPSLLLAKLISFNIVITTNDRGYLITFGENLKYLS